MDVIKCGVYKITCTKNNKIYIGSSKHIKKRWKEHIESLNNNRHNNFYLQSDWNYYGEKSFKFEVLELCKEDKQFELEQKYLDKLKPYNKNGNGYNICEKAQPIGKINMRIYTPSFEDGENRPFGIESSGMGYVYGQKIKMPITQWDYEQKTREELYDEYEGYTTLLALEDDLKMCNPDW